MSDTPETDLEDDLYLECASPCIVKESTGAIFTGNFVPAEFARRLERDRDQAQSLVKALSAKCDKIEADKEYNAELAREFKLERNEALKGEGELGDLLQKQAADIGLLKELYAELLVALEVVLDDWQYGLEIHQADSYDIAREVLTKAKAIKP
jgi:hypothetical protein